MPCTHFVNGLGAHYDIPARQQTQCATKRRLGLPRFVVLRHKLYEMRHFTLFFRWQDRRLAAYLFDYIRHTVFTLSWSLKIKS
jgi:hypothetical protein